MDNEIKIGRAVIAYDAAGRPLTGHFDSYINVPNIDDLLPHLLTLPADKQEDAMLHNGQILMSQFFLNVHAFELANRAEYEIASRMTECEKYADGLPRQVCIEFYMKPLMEPISSN